MPIAVDVPPMFSEVAAPAKLTVVALALSKAIVEEEVVIEVATSGLRSAFEKTNCSEELTVRVTSVLAGDASQAMVSALASRMTPASAGSAAFDEKTGEVYDVVAVEVVNAPVEAVPLPMGPG